MPAEVARLRLGIDLGGSKIAGVVLDRTGASLAQHRIPAPQHDYAATLRAIVEMVGTLQQSAGGSGTVGIGMPGSIAPGGGGVQNANSTWLNGRPFAHDLAQVLNMPVRLANDANCFALSEAVDGAGAGARSLFGVILGTGCGGGLIFEGKLIDGPRGTGGEWGHNPLPWAEASEHPGPLCWCGRRGCLERWVSGPGLEADHLKHTGAALSATAIAADGWRWQCRCRRLVAAAREPPGARACPGGQHLRSRGRRARRRAVAASAPLRLPAWADGPPHPGPRYQRHRQAAALGRCQRRARRSLAVAVRRRRASAGPRLAARGGGPTCPPRTYLVRER